MSGGRRIVIIGAGEAGTRAAITLRDLGWAGSITLVGDEPHFPYERPPLSKARLLGDPQHPVPAIADAATLQHRGVERLPGIAVSRIDRDRHAVAAADGLAIPYDQLCLATGAKPRRLTSPGSEAVLYLRTFDDAGAIQRRFVPGVRLAIVGAGFLGLELAASAREHGCDVTVVEAAPRVLMRGVPAAIAEVIATRHRAAGVRLFLGAGISTIRHNGDATLLGLADGSELAADCVVAAIGVVPETTLAAAAGLAIDNGIAVDAQLRTSDPDIFAAGDCASFPHPLYGGRRVRLEAWRNAQEQGAFAARTMTGSSDHFAAVPWFWSDQYDLHLQIAGLADEATTTVERDLGQGARLLFHLGGDGRLLAATGLGPVSRVGKEVRVAEMLIARRACPDPGCLASPAFKLKALLAA